MGLRARGVGPPAAPLLGEYHQVLEVDARVFIQVEMDLARSATRRNVEITAFATGG
jgi:hypothetical protein